MTKEKQLAVTYKNPMPTPAATEIGDELAELAGGIDVEEWDAMWNAATKPKSTAARGLLKQSPELAGGIDTEEWMKDYDVDESPERGADFRGLQIDADESPERGGGIDTEEWMKDYFKNVRPIRRKGGQ